MLNLHALRKSDAGNVPLWMMSRSDHAVPATPFRIELSATDRILRKTRQVALGCQRVTCTHAYPVYVAANACAYMVFHRNGVRLHSSLHRAEIATPMHVSFHPVGSVHVREALEVVGNGSDWIAIAPDFLRRLNLAPAADSVCIVSSEIFLTCRRLFAAATRTFGALNSRAIDASVAQLIARVLEHMARVRAAHESCRALCGRASQLVEEAKAILAGDCCADLSAADLARLLLCSPAYLSRTFHAATGSKLVNYRHDLRLYRGVHLIEQADAELSEVAARLGFCSHSHFSNAFRKRFGMTPSEYLNSI